MLKKILIVALIFPVFNFGTVGFCKTKQDKPKPPSQSTSKENKIRKQNFDLCVQSGRNRSNCYYLYY